MAHGTFTEYRAEPFALTELWAVYRYVRPVVPKAGDGVSRTPLRLQFTTEAGAKSYAEDMNALAARDRKRLAARTSASGVVYPAAGMALSEKIEWLERELIAARSK